MTDQGAKVEVTEQLEGDGQRTVDKGIAPPTTGISPDALTPVAVERSASSEAESKPSTSSPPLKRDEKGRFQPKRPLEFTWPHFWLEVTEVALAILIAQAIWEGGAWLIR